MWMQVAHDCAIIGEGGAYWPGPTFRVVAQDRPQEPLLAKSCTGCWTQVPYQPPYNYAHPRVQPKGDTKNKHLLSSPHIRHNDRGNAAVSVP